MSKEIVKPNYLSEGEDLVSVNPVTLETTTRPTLVIDASKVERLKDLLEEKQEIDAEIESFKEELKSYIESTDKTVKVLGEGLEITYKDSYIQRRLDNSWAKTQPWYETHKTDVHYKSSLSVKLADNE